MKKTYIVQGRTRWIIRNNNNAFISVSLLRLFLRHGGLLTSASGRCRMFNSFGCRQSFRCCSSGSTDVGSIFRYKILIVAERKIIQVLLSTAKETAKKKQGFFKTNSLLANANNTPEEIIATPGVGFCWLFRMLLGARHFIIIFTTPFLRLRRCGR